MHDFFSVLLTALVLLLVDPKQMLRRLAYRQATISNSYASPLQVPFALPGALDASPNDAAAQQSKKRYYDNFVVPVSYSGIDASHGC